MASSSSSTQPNGQGSSSTWEEKRQASGATGDAQQGWVSRRELPSDLGVWVLKNSERLGIQWDSLPQMPFFAAPLFPQAWYRKEVSGRVIAASVIVGRQLTPPEVDAVASAGAKYCVYRAWELPAFVGLTYLLESRGRAALRFPFWTPKPTAIDPYAFPGGRLTFLKGPVALRAWHALRVAAYASVTRVGTVVFFHSFAQSTFLAAIFRDPRLTDLREAARHMDPRQRPKRDPAVLFGDRPPSSGNEDPSMQDAYSPFADPNAPLKQQQQTQPVNHRGGFPAPQQRQPPQQAYPPTQSQPSSSSPHPSYPPSSSSAPADSEAYLFDDASPVAPSARQASMSGMSGSGGGDSNSWESLRQQAAREQSGRSASNAFGRQERQVGSWGQRRRDAEVAQGQAGGSSSSSSPSSAKDNAQRAFDEMLEKERRGETGDSGRRW